MSEVVVIVSVLFSFLPDCVHVVLHLRHFSRVEAHLLPNANLLRELNLVHRVVVAVGFGETLSDALLFDLDLVIVLNEFLEVFLQRG